MVVTRIGALSLAKILGVLYALIGLIIGAAVSLFALIAGASGLGESGAFESMVFGVAAVVILPVFYGAIGFVTSLLTAWLYNLVAGWVGGIEMDVQ